MPVFEQPKETPVPPKNAADEVGHPVIHSAAWANAEQTAVAVQCELQDSGQGVQLYVLNATDPYGSSPALRAELDRMVDEEGMVIDPYVPQPGEAPEAKPA